MKRRILYNALCIAFISVAIVACNDYDPVTVEYENVPDEGGVTVTPPEIDLSWDLQLIPNVGERDVKVFAYKDKKYDKLFTRTLGWNGGDGVQTTLLPDGNTFWTFNDSFYGVVDAETRARRGCSFPRNSIMVQTPGDEETNLIWLADYVQTNNPDAERYYQARTHIRHPKASFSEEEILKGEIDRDYFYWAGDATVYDGKLQMLWAAVDATDSSNPMRRDGTCLVTYSLEGHPGDDTYLKIIDKNYDFNTDKVGYGSTLWEDEDGHTYLYVAESYRPMVARTTTHDLNSQWEYYIRDVNGNFQWIKQYPTEEERKRSSIMANNYLCNMPWVFKKGDWYYMTAQAIFYGHAIYIYRSKTPYGPFTDQKVLFVIPNTVDKIGNPYYQNLYMVNIHPHLSRQGELVFSTNTDTAEFGDNFNHPGSADFYRPYFYRVFNWESVYDENE